MNPKSATRPGGLDLVREDDLKISYRKLRNAAFPTNPDCREHCTNFNDILNMFHDQIVEGQITLNDGVELVSDMASVNCTGPQDALGRTATVAFRCGVPEDLEL